jgi:hypothetical protein
LRFDSQSVYIDQKILRSVKFIFAARLCAGHGAGVG